MFLKNLLVMIKSDCPVNSFWIMWYSGVWEAIRDHGHEGGNDEWFHWWGHGGRRWWRGKVTLKLTLLSNNSYSNFFVLIHWKYELLTYLTISSPWTEVLHAMFASYTNWRLSHYGVCQQLSMGIGHVPIITFGPVSDYS